MTTTISWKFGKGSSPKVVFVLGGPGAGKGTQCENIVKDFDFAHLSAGDLLRAERASGSKNAELINHYINEGMIVPVEITVGLIKTAMEGHVAKGTSNFLIDGFPRNQDNVEGWYRVVGDWATVAAVLYFECPEDVMEKRMLGRGRGDDNIETIRKRFNTYWNSTKPIIDHYASKNLVKTVGGDKPVDEVYIDVKKIISAILVEDAAKAEGNAGDKFTGSCVCESIVIETDGPPNSSHFCHCYECRAFNAAPFRELNIFDEDKVRIVKGEDLIVPFNMGESCERVSSPAAKYITVRRHEDGEVIRNQRCTCSNCGCVVLIRVPKINIYSIDTMVFRDKGDGKLPDKKFHADHHHHYSERIMDIDDGLPKYDNWCPPIAEG